MFGGTSSRHVFKTSSRRLQDVLEDGKLLRQRRAEEVFKTCLCWETSNICEIPEQQHKKLLHDNVTKTYKKAPPKLETSVNLEVKKHYRAH